jgi:hypothetical protein
MLKKVSHAGAQSGSFPQAVKDLAALAETKVTRERVRRWTERVGTARLAESQAAAEAYQALPLPQQRQSPQDQVPQMACVQMDGGRLQIRARQEHEATHDRAGHWRESLVGCLVSMTSVEHDEDPCPQIPKTFVDPARMADLAREIKGFSQTAADEGAALEAVESAPDDRADKPRVLVRSVVATCLGVAAFGPRLIAAAHARGFNAAARKAFVCDGSATNWSVHRQYFSHYTPILDFTHAICYVYAAAVAGVAARKGWETYCQWAQWLWSGEIAPLLAALEARAASLGPPRADDAESCPRRIVDRTLTYVTHQATRMKYAEYRRQGLPITSSHVESTIKQINRRVKGSEKFWDQGAEPILQLVADHLSETLDLDHYWRRRPNTLPTTRRYQTAA